jgi:hypothetical protein
MDVLALVHHSRLYTKPEPQTSFPIQPADYIALPYLRVVVVMCGAAHKQSPSTHATDGIEEEAAMIL